MTVQELIEKLGEVEDKSKPVFCYVVTAFEAWSIDEIDFSISDRVDMNAYTFRSVQDKCLQGKKPSPDGRAKKAIYDKKTGMRIGR